MSATPVTVSHGAEIAAAPDDVYALVADASRRPEWLGELRSTTGPPGPLRRGDRFTAQVSVLGHELFGVSEVAGAENGRSLTEEVTLGIRFESSWTFVATRPGGTRIDHVIRLDLPGGVFGRLERWLLARRLSGMQRASLAAIGHALSGGSSRPQPSRWLPRRRG